MFGKITKGSGFRGCVEYVTRKKKDGPDGTPCDEWRLIDSGSIGGEEDREEIIRSFEDNRSLNPRVKNPVGHISLNFDTDRATKNEINDIIKYVEELDKKRILVEDVQDIIASSFFVGIPRR